MVKFGITYLDKGYWDGQKIISVDWVDKSSTPYQNNYDINIPGEDSGKNAYGYTYLIRWSEHYLTLPLHFGAYINNKIRVAAGPALSYDLGYFKDFGVSAAIYYHFNDWTAISISAFTFTLYDYHIDYLYIPLAVSYNDL